LPLDLALRIALPDPARDVELHLSRDRRVRLVERRVTSRADHLALELAERRAPPACRGRRHEREREHEDGERPHASALRIPAASVCRSTAPGSCATTLPAALTKNVSGAPVTPYRSSHLPLPSRTTG